MSKPDFDEWKKDVETRLWRSHRLMVDHVGGAQRAYAEGETPQSFVREVEVRLGLKAAPAATRSTR